MESIRDAALRLYHRLMGREQFQHQQQQRTLEQVQPNGIPRQVLDPDTTLAQQTFARLGQRTEPPARELPRDGYEAYAAHLREVQRHREQEQQRQQQQSQRGDGRGY